MKELRKFIDIRLVKVLDFLFISCKWNNEKYAGITTFMDSERFEQDLDCWDTNNEFEKEKKMKQYNSKGYKTSYNITKDPSKPSLYMTHILMEVLEESLPTLAKFLYKREFGVSDEVSIDKVYNYLLAKKILIKPDVPMLCQLISSSEMEENGIWLPYVLEVAGLLDDNVFWKLEQARYIVRPSVRNADIKFREQKKD